MTVFEKFKEYCNNNPTSNESMVKIAESLGVDYLLLRQVVWRKKKDGVVKVLQPTIKQRYKFK